MFFFCRRILTSAAKFALNPKKRGRRILAAAAANEADVLVLGAFGCGAFRNPPEIVAKAYRELLPEFDGSFERVEFAVYCTPQARGNYETFARALQAEEGR